MSQIDLLLDATNLYKIYKSGDEHKTIETVALKGVNLTVRKGDFIAIMGPSGSGKTTLINCLSGLDTPSAGDITYYFNGGREVKLSHLTEKQRDEFRIGKLAVVFQTENLVKSLTAKENAEISLDFLNIKDKSIIPMVFQSLGIDHRLNHKPDELSGGEKQRVSLACALVYNPQIIIADEPTGELDSLNAAKIIEYIKELNRELGQTFIVVTHDNRFASMTDLTYKIRDGTIYGIHRKFLDGKKTKSIYDREHLGTLDSFGTIRLPEDLITKAKLKFYVRFVYNQEKNCIEIHPGTDKVEGDS